MPGIGCLSIMIGGSHLQMATFSAHSLCYVCHVFPDGDPTSLTLIFHFHSCPAPAGKSHGFLSLCPGSSYCGTGCPFLWALKRSSDCPWLSLPLREHACPSQLTHFFMEEGPFLCPLKSPSLFQWMLKQVHSWPTLGDVTKFPSPFSSRWSGNQIRSCSEWQCSLRAK